VREITSKARRSRREVCPCSRFIERMTDIAFKTETARISWADPGRGIVKPP